MKVVMLVANNFTDDVWTDPRVSKEAQALLMAGHEVVVVASGKYGRPAPRAETKDGVRIIRRMTLLHTLYGVAARIKKPRMPAGEKRTAVYYDRGVRGLRARFTVRVLQFLYDLNNLLFCPAVLAAAVRERGAIYVGHDLNALPPAWFAARLTGARLIYNSHELWTERVRSVPYGRLHRAIVSRIERVLVRRCDMLIAVSDSVAEELARRYSVAKPMVIPNVHPFVESQARPEIRERLTGGREGRVVIYVGYLDRGKGLEQLIEAAQYLPGVVISIVGDGVLKPALEALTRAQGVEDRVHFVGWVRPEDLPLYVASADLGVTPLQSSSLNYYFNIDNKFFHYIAAGIPLASSRQPDKTRIIEQYRIGTTFDETDPRDIARAISELISDPVEYSAMRSRCLAAAKETLNWGVVAGRYVAALEGLSTPA